MTNPSPAFHVAQCGCIVLNNWERIPDTTTIKATVVRDCCPEESISGLPDDITLVTRHLMADRREPVPLSEAATEMLVNDLRQLVRAGYTAFDLKYTLNVLGRITP